MNSAVCRMKRDGELGLAEQQDDQQEQQAARLPSFVPRASRGGNRLGIAATGDGQQSSWGSGAGMT